MKTTPSATPKVGDGWYCDDDGSASHIPYRLVHHTRTFGWGDTTLNDASYAPIVEFVRNIYFGFPVMCTAFSRISGFSTLLGISTDSCQIIWGGSFKKSIGFSSIFWDFFFIFPIEKVLSLWKKSMLRFWWIFPFWGPRSRAVNANSKR